MAFDGWPDLRATYDTVARPYAAAFAGELAGKPFDRTVLEDLAAKVGPGARAADLGCGPAAQVGVHLARQGVRVVGVDLSPACCALTPLPSTAGDLLRLPLRDASLQAVVSFYAVIHLPRTLVPQALSEMSRVLVPGGRLLLAVHAGDGEHEQQGFLGQDVAFKATLFERSELWGLLAAAGFDDVRVARRAPYDDEHQTHRLYATAVRTR